jgi:hypothetical protein
VGLQRCGHVPWQQIVDLADGIVSDLCQHCSQIELRIESVEFSRADQGVHGCGTLTTVVGSPQSIETAAQVRHTGPQSRSGSPQEAGSLPQALQNRTQQNRIDTALYTDHCPTRKFDVDRASSRCHSSLWLSALFWTRYRNRDQRRAGLTQFATFKCSTPLEQTGSRSHPVPAQLRPHRHPARSVNCTISSFSETESPPANSTAGTQLHCLRAKPIFGSSPYPHQKGLGERLPSADPSAISRKAPFRWASP